MKCLRFKAPIQSRHSASELTWRGTTINLGLKLYNIQEISILCTVATSPHFLESESSPSPACLELSPSPSLTGQDSSPSPAGFESESESRCLLLESESESQVAEISQL